LFIYLTPEQARSNPIFFNGGRSGCRPQKIISMNRPDSQGILGPKAARTLLPAPFFPQLASALLKQNSSEGEPDACDHSKTH
jgi:hypothetical protein